MTRFFYIGLTLLLSQNLISQGILFDKNRYYELPNYESPKSQGFSNDASVTKLSYREYCPQIYLQNGSTCVGWSIYSMLSTQQNILMDENNTRLKYFRSMDPYFVYSLIRNKNDKWCEQGTYPQDALDVLQNYGTKPLFAFPDIKCNSNITTSNLDKKLQDILATYSISNYYSIYANSYTEVELVSVLKGALKDKKPILVGLPTSQNLSGIDNNIWMPDPDGQHAMCIVGYDDKKLDGCFELMNSWGSDWGENGFAWIRYEDIYNFLEQAYVVEINSDVIGFRKGQCSLGDCNSTFSRYSYSNGDVYEGQFKNGLRHGWGMLVDKDYNEYIGEFENGYKHGWGVTYTPLTGIYTKTYFNYGKAELAANKQGFSGSQDDKKLDEVMQLMQTKRAGKILDPNSVEYEEYIESLKSEEEPVKAE